MLIDLDHQRKLAKELLRAHKRGDREAAERIARHLPRARLPIKLADAQLVIAREAGFASWPRLERYCELADCIPPLHAAVRAADLDRVRAALETAEPWQTREAIEQAIARDDRAIVTLLLEHRGWVDTAGRSYGRWGGGLHAALLLGKDLAMIETLLAGGASIAALDRDGRTPLAISVRTANEAAAAALRRAGASDAEVDALDRALGACIAGGRPAREAWQLQISDHQHLAWAIRRGHEDAVPALLALGLDPDVADDDLCTPLQLARSAATIEQLVAAGARPTRESAVDEELFEEAADAVVAGNLDRLRTLLDREPGLVTARSLRPHRCTLLHYTGANGVEHARMKSPKNAPEVAALLLARGADPNAVALTYGGGPAQTTLYLAVTSSCPDDAGIMVPLIDALLAGGARIHDDDREQLHATQRSALPALVAGGMTVDLWVAATLGRIADVRRFVRADGSLAPGAKVGSEARAPDQLVKDRALHSACASGHAAIVEILVDAGASLDARDVEGMTPLHQAAWHDRLEVVRLLIARGAPVAARNVYGGTALGTLRWAIENRPEPRPDADAIIAALVAAGAT